MWVHADWKGCRHHGMASAIIVSPVYAPGACQVGKDTKTDVTNPNGIDMHLCQLAFDLFTGTPRSFMMPHVCPSFLQELLREGCSAKKSTKGPRTSAWI